MMKILNLFRRIIRTIRILLNNFNNHLFRGGTRFTLAWLRRAFHVTLGLDNLDLARHLDHGTSFFHGAVSFSFGGRNINHIALLILVAVRFFNSVGNLDGVAFGFAVININGLSGWNLDIYTFLDLLTIRFLDNVGYLNNFAVRYLYINANCFGAGNLGGDLLGDIFANLLGDLCTD